eukprot:7106496-Pyramimonas_sp.AAC.1
MRGRAPLKRPEWPKVAPTGLQRAEDDLQGGLHCLKTLFKTFEEVPRTPQDGPKGSSSSP